MLLDGRLGKLLQQPFNVSGDVHRLHLAQVMHSPALAPPGEPARGLVIGPPRVSVADVRREEIAAAFAWGTNSAGGLTASAAKPRGTLTGTSSFEKGGRVNNASRMLHNKMRF